MMHTHGAIPSSVASRRRQRKCSMATQAEETLHRCQEIILIGPVCTGKSTLAPLLADRLKVPQVSLDQISLTYLEELGYSRPVTKFSSVSQSERASLLLESLGRS